jgi:hypothetical protein
VDILLVSLVDTFIVCVFTVDDIVSCVDGIAPCVDIAEFAWPIFLDVNFEIPFVTECIPGLVEDVEISFVSKVAVFATVKLCNEDVDAICSFPFKEMAGRVCCWQLGCRVLLRICKVKRSV